MNRRQRMSLLLVVLATPTVGAQTMPPNAGAPLGDQARILQDAVAGAQGRIAINQAAGVGNTQANLAAIAISPDGRGLVDLHAHQQTQAGNPLRAASARIEGQTFTDASGLLSLNQAAGSGNAQLNLFAIGHGDAMANANVIAGLDDAALAAVAGDNRTEGAEVSSMVRTATIEGGAFRGSQGVVQVNQAAGVGNASVNAIVLQLPGGAL